MPEFRLACTVTVSAYTKVEAATLEEAMKIAETRSVEMWGGACTKDAHWIVDSLDGLPQNIEADPDA